MLFASVVAPFVVAQYNVLAGYLGDNRQPWFFHGLDLSQARRSQVTKKFYERDKQGKLVNFGWPNYVKDILSEKEVRRVEQVHDEFFSWDVRKPRLLETVRDLDADLISLVECDHFDDFWREQMETLGYGAIYKQRPRRSCKDGCAIFYRRSVFELESSQAIEFSSISCIDGDDDGAPSYGDRVALLALFRHIDSGRRLVFISTHLARNPEDPSKTKDRARQIAQLLYHLTQFATEHNAMSDEDGSDNAVPAMIAGDMNDSNLRQIATLARIKCGLADQACHPLVFTSRAPKTVDTSVTSCRQMCIDYLLLQSSLLEVVEGFEMEHVSPDHPIPNEQHPSDHLPIVFRIAFRDYATAVRSYAASWVRVVTHTAKGTEERLQKDNRSLHRRKSPLRLDELRMAFGFFDKDGDGSCELDELRAGLAQLHDTHGEEEQAAVGTFLNCLESQTEGATLTLTEFTTIYIKSWLRQQDSFVSCVHSMQTIFDLDLSSLLNRGGGAEWEELNVDDLFDYVVRNNFGADSFRNRVRDAFSFFDFDASGAFDLVKLYESFSTACPFDVKVELIRDVFDDMDKDYDEKITLDEFTDYLVRNHLINDPSWVSLKDVPSCALDDQGSTTQ